MMRLKSNIFISCQLGVYILFVSTVLFAQKEYNNWYFGNKAGITFNYGLPEVLNDSKIYAWEGCASISDTAGNLLFYTNGQVLFNRNHDTMEAGLLGGFSSTHAATIVPQPGSNSLYYIFNAPELGVYQQYDLVYSIVDMTLNDGLGGVVSPKNIILKESMGEKLTYVKHNNDMDYWIIGHEINSNRFCSWLLSNSGIGQEVISQIGHIHYSAINNIVSLGCIRVSHDMKKIALAINDTGGIAPTAKVGYLEIFDFDNETGIVSNPVHIPNILRPYGVEFSYDNSKLFTASSDGSVGKMYQYQLKSMDGKNLNAQEIKASEAILNVSGSVGAFQMGPDRKIYVTKPQSNYLGVIEDPDMKGLNSYVEQSVFLGNGQTLSGLPNYTIMYKDILRKTECNNIFIPNSFSPNQDAINDVFCVNGISEATISIFDKIGTELFKSYDDLCWDGFYNGRKIVAGNYFYIFSHAQCGKITGNITVIF